jgi:hypothetical protein
VSAEGALVGAILAAIGADAGVQVLLGDPMRVADAASPLPKFPYLEVVRHDVRPAGSVGVEACEHFVELAVFSPVAGGAQAREAMAAMRTVIESAELEMDGWRCGLLLPVFADTMRIRPHLWRSLLRLRAVVEPG